MEEPTRPSLADRDNVVPHAMPQRRKDGEGSLQLTAYRTDHKQMVRLDVVFKVAELLDPDGVAETRADAHVALDLLLDRLIGR